MRYLLLFMLLFGLFAFGRRSCHFTGFGVEGKGPVQTEMRSVGGFTAIDSDLSAEVEVSTGDYRVEIKAQENILPLIKTVVENGKLKLYSDEGFNTSESVKILVSLPALDALSLDGSGEIKVVSPFQSDKMMVAIGGSGNIYFSQTSVNTLECTISGSGGMEIGGKANSAQVDVSGSGEVDAKGLEINELRANISGSGNVKAHVNQVLKAEISGSGEVRYLGDPSVQSNISGSGSVSKI